MGTLYWKAVVAILVGALMIGGTLTYTDLFGALFQLKGINATYSGDSYCKDTNETNKQLCNAYVNVTTSYWRVCFANYNGTKYENETLFKKWSPWCGNRCRTLHVNMYKVDNIITTELLLNNGTYIPYDMEVDWLVPTYGKRWRPIKDGDCWDRKKINKINLESYKETQQTVKWSFVVDEYLDIDPLWLGDSTTSIAHINKSLNWEITKTGIEKYLDVNYEILNETSTRFCISLTDKDKIIANLTADLKDIRDIPISKEKGDSLFTIDSSINLINADKEEECFDVNYDKLELGMQFKIGWNTVIVHTSDIGSGDNMQSWQNRVFFDTNNDRWHVLYIENDSDIHSTSSTDKTTWVDGIDVGVGTYDYDDFDCVLDIDGASTFLHCAYSVSTSDVLFYKRMTLTGTTPFITAGTEETPFDSSVMDGTLFDDVKQPKITQDSDRCLLIAFDFFNNSATEKYSLTLIKEDAGTTCGDGDFDIADILSPFPLYSIQEGLGYAGRFALGIDTFGDLDAQLFWINSNVTGTFELETIFFNGTTNKIGTQRILDSDVEGANGYASYYSVINGNDTITFAMDDGTTDLDAYRTTGKNGSLSSQADTGIAMANAFTSGFVSAIVTTQIEGVDDTIVFAIDKVDDEDIYNSNSTDVGVSWIGQNLWHDGSGEVLVRFISAHYETKNCDIGVSWIGGLGVPFTINFDSLATDKCVVAGDTCTCAGLNNDWEIDHLDACNIVDDCDLGTGTLTFINTGTTTCDAQIDTTNLGDPGAGGILQINDDCVINVASD